MFTRDPWRRPRLLTFCLACVGILALLAGGRWLYGVIESHQWRAYNDSHAHFQVQIPPSWRAVTIPASQPNDGCDERGVALLAPDYQTLPADAPVGEYAARYIEVTTQVNCIAVNLSLDSTLRADPNQVNIGGVPTTLYVHTPDSSGVSMLATVMFGQRQFLFSFASLAATCSEDSTLFYNVLREFKYTGS